MGLGKGSSIRHIQLYHEIHDVGGSAGVLMQLQLYDETSLVRMFRAIHWDLPGN